MAFLNAVGTQGGDRVLVKLDALLHAPPPQVFFSLSWFFHLQIALLDLLSFITFLLPPHVRVCVSVCCGTCVEVRG